MNKMTKDFNNDVVIENIAKSLGYDYLSKYLTLTTLERGVQIVTLNDLDSYKEYSPYTLVNNEVDFISKVVNM